MKVWMLCEEPADYTLELVRRVYAPRGVSVVFRRGCSAASAERCAALDDLGLWGRVRTVIRALRTHEVVVLNGYSGFDHWLVILLNAFGWRRPLGLWSDAQALASTRSPWRRWLKARALRWLYARRFVWGLAISEGTHAEAYRQYGLKAERLRLLPLVSELSGVGADDRVRPGGELQVAYLGRLVAHKRVDRLLEAVRLATAAGMAVRLTVVGDGPERPTWERQAAGLKVDWVGAVHGAALAARLQAADVLALVSDYEPWGLVVNEALALGRPVVVSERVGARALLEAASEPAGMVATDPAAIAAAWRQLADPARYARYAAAAKVAVAGWSYDFHARCWDEWLQELSRSR